MRILVVEDSPRLANTLRDALETENYMADVALDGKAGYESAMSGIYDLVILDLMLPSMNGYEVLRAMRDGRNEVPVLILSAKSELDDKVSGFMSGADDYVTKPFEIKELLMRIRAILRRRGTMESAMLRAGDLELDAGACMIKNTESGRTMKIAGKEMQLLELFLMNKNQVLRKEQIATRVWGYDSDAEYNNVEVYVSFLRRKFNHLKVHAGIRAVRGVGYILEEYCD